MTEERKVQIVKKLKKRGKDFESTVDYSGVQ